MGAPQALATGLAALLVLGLAQRTWTRTPVWRSSEALFELDVARDPRHREGRFVLALLLLERGRNEEAKAHADTLLAQRSETGRWSSYLMWGHDRELHCLASERVGRDDDVLQLWDGDGARRTLEAWRAPGYHECVARTFERAGRVEDALAIWLQIHRAAGPGAQAPFTLAIARCHARLGRVAKAREWLALVPRGAGYEPEIRRIAQLLRRGRS